MAPITQTWLGTMTNSGLTLELQDQILYLHHALHHFDHSLAFLDYPFCHLDHPRRHLRYRLRDRDCD
jgi:hypothetical protein